MARIDPELYVTEEMKFGVGNPATIAQGIIEIAMMKKSQPEVDRSSAFLPSWMRDILSCKSHEVGPRAGRGSRFASSQKCLLQPLAVSPFLQAYAAFKPADLEPMLRQHLNDRDVIVRATCAELLAEQPPNDANIRALI